MLAALAGMLVAAMAAEAAPAIGAAPPPDMSQALSLLVEARINGAPLDGLIGLERQAPECTRIETAPLRAAGIYNGTEAASCLEALPGIEYTLDVQAARLDIFAAAAPRPRVIFPKQDYAPALTGLTGAYGLSGQRVYDGREEIINAFGDLSLTLHTPAGRLQNDLIATHDGEAAAIRRLMTVYEFDIPERMTRFSLGDNFSRAPRWGRIAAFAGAQYGTDFSMDPTDSWRPYRTFQALLRQQSEVDVRVNGVVRRKDSVDPGYNNFEISPESGLNEVEIIIQEASGLRRIEDFSFFSSPDALAGGVTDYSVSIGVPRRFSGISSTYEDTLLASGLLRHGVSDALTAETYAEITGKGGLWGGGGQVVAGNAGILSLSAGMSRAEDGRTGHILSAGIERNTRRGSLQFQARLADADYTDAVSIVGAAFPDRSIRASGGVYTKAGSFRATYIEEEDKVLSDRRFLSVGWEKPFASDRFALAASAYQDFARDETGFAISLRMAFGPYSASGGYQSAGGHPVRNVQVSRSRQPGDRVQWSARAADGGGRGVYQADAAVDLGVAEAVVNGGIYGETSQVMAGIRGGFAAMTGRLSLHRQTTGASAVVRAPALPHLPIYKDNRIVAVTGANGVAVVPDVRPFEVNSLRVRPEDVPLEFEISDFTTRFVPRYGISEVRFDIRRQSALAFTMRLPNGAVIPPGSRVELLRSGAVCPVGLEGRVYCAAADAEDSLAITLPEGRFVWPVSHGQPNGEVRLGPEMKLKLAGID